MSEDLTGQPCPWRRNDGGCDNKPEHCRHCTDDNRCTHEPSRNLLQEIFGLPPNQPREIGDS